MSIVNNATINGSYGFTAQENTGGIFLSGNGAFPNVSIYNNNCPITVSNSSITNTISMMWNSGYDLVVVNNPYIQSFEGQNNYYFGAQKKIIIDNNVYVGVYRSSWNGAAWSITNNSLVNFTRDPSDPYGWMGSSYNIIVKNNTVVNGDLRARRSGGFGSVYALFEGNSIINASTSFQNTNSSGVRYLNNTVINGYIMAEGCDVDILGNGQINDYINIRSASNKDVSLSNNSISGSVSIDNVRQADIDNNTVTGLVSLRAGSYSSAMSITDNPQLAGISINNNNYSVIPVITGNSILNDASSYGISVTLGGASVANNYIFSNLGGIEVSDSYTNLKINQNSVLNNRRSGIRVQSTPLFTITNNVILSNGLDDYVENGEYFASGIQVRDSTFNNVTGNTIRNNKFAGIASYSSGGTIYNNTVQNNGTTTGGSFVCEGVGGNGRGGFGVRNLDAGEVLSIDNNTVVDNTIKSVQHRPGSLGDLYYEGSLVAPGGAIWNPGDMIVYITTSNTTVNGADISGGSIWGVVVTGMVDNVSITNCAIHDNGTTANTAGPDGETVGGGILIAAGADVYMSGNSVYNNGLQAQTMGSSGYVGVALRCAGTNTTLVNNTIENNANDGIAFRDANGYIGLSGQGNTIRNNGRHGVGLISFTGGSTSTPVIAYNLIYSNTAFGVGGYSVVNMAATMSNNLIYSNHAATNTLGPGGTDIGGGVNFYSLTNVALVDANTVRNNAGVNVGGIGTTLSNGTLSVTNNLITGNSGTASQSSGGIGLRSTGSAFVLYADGNTITNNSGYVAGGIGGTLGNAASITISNNEIGNHGSDSGVGFERFTFSNGISVVNNDENGGIHNNNYGVSFRYNGGNIYIGDSNSVTNSGTGGIRASSNEGVTVKNNTVLDSLGDSWSGYGFEYNSGPILITGNGPINGYGLAARYNTGGISFTNNQYIHYMDFWYNTGNVIMAGNTTIDEMIGQAQSNSGGSHFLVDNNTNVSFGLLGAFDMDFSITNNSLVNINTTGFMSGWAGYGGGLPGGYSMGVVIKGNSIVNNNLWAQNMRKFEVSDNSVINASLNFRYINTDGLKISNNTIINNSIQAQDNSFAYLLGNTAVNNTVSFQNSEVSVANNSLDGSYVSILNTTNQMDFLNNTASATINIRAGSSSTGIRVADNPQLTGGVSINNSGYAIIPEITGNSFINNASSYGVSVTTGGASVANNYVSSCTGGIRFENVSLNVNVLDNTIYNASLFAIRQASGSIDATIKNNTIDNVDIGMFNAASGTFQLYDNTITNVTTCYSGSMNDVQGNVCSGGGGGGVPVTVTSYPLTQPLCIVVGSGPKAMFGVTLTPAAGTVNLGDTFTITSTDGMPNQSPARFTAAALYEDNGDGVYDASDTFVSNMDMIWAGNTLSCTLPSNPDYTVASGGTDFILVMTSAMVFTPTYVEFNMYYGDLTMDSPGTVDVFSDITGDQYTLGSPLVCPSVTAGSHALSESTGVDKGGISAMFGLKLTASSGIANLYDLRIRFDSSATGNQSDLSDFAFYVDDGSTSGQFDVSDTLIGSLAWNAGYYSLNTIDPNQTIATSPGTDFMAVGTVSTGATSNATLQFSLANGVSDLQVDFPYTVNAFTAFSGNQTYNVNPTSVSVASYSTTEATTVVQGTTYAMLGFTLTASVGTADLAGVRVKLDASSTGGQSDISGLTLYEDTNADGKYSSGTDSSIGAMTWNAGSGYYELSANPSQPITSSGTDFIVAVAVDAAAAGGNTLLFRLDNTASDLSVDSPDTVNAFTAFTGNQTFTVNPTSVSVASYSTTEVTTVVPGTTYAMLGLTLTASPGPADLAGMRVKLDSSSTGGVSDISTVTLYEDTNADGKYSSGTDSSIGTMTWNAGSGYYELAANPSQPITVSGNNFIVAVTVDAAATGGNTLLFRLDNTASDLVVDSPNTVNAFTAFTGNQTFTVQGGAASSITITSYSLSEPLCVLRGSQHAMFGFTATTDQGDANLGAALKFDQSWSGGWPQSGPGLVQSAALYEDDGDGVFDGGDTFVTNMTYHEGSWGWPSTSPYIDMQGQANPDYTVTSTGTNFILVITVSAGASPGQYLDYTLKDGNVTMEASQAGSSLPVNSFTNFTQDQYFIQMSCP
ncbi:MAG: beta strand repeat-containing protein [bacterium]